jgi:hypothetical protein
LNRTKMRNGSAHENLRTAITNLTLTVLVPNNCLFADSLLVRTQASLQVGLKTFGLANSRTDLEIMISKD